MSDADFMHCAFRLALEHPDTTRNKAIGAVLVKDGRIISEGWRETTLNVDGYDDKTVHAEDMAVSNATCDTTGTTLYCTLEPCVMRAQSPKWYPSRPCCEIIAEAGIARVVVGINDEDFGGGGSEYLRQRGIPVEFCDGVDDESFRILTANPTATPEQQAEMDRFLERIALHD